MIDTSKFKTIPGFSRYMISEYGDVYSIPSKKIIAVAKNWAGYLTVTITDDKNFRSPRKVHRLVYLTYIGPLKDNLVVDYKDDNKLNNHYSNLQQVTPSFNSTKSFITGGNKNKVVWSKEQIALICEMMEQNIYSPKIFESIGVVYQKNREACNHLIGQLRRGEIHQDIASKYDIKNYVIGINKKDVKFSIDEVQNIYMRLLFGETPAELAKEYNVSHSTICKIRDKKTWKIVTNKIDEYFE